jgi:hypothetical protein
MVARAGEALAQYDASISSALAVDVSGGDVNMPRLTRGVYIGASGNLVVQFAGDAGNVTLTGLAAGVWHPMQVQKFIQTSTTATGIVAGF